MEITSPYAPEIKSFLERLGQLENLGGAGNTWPSQKLKFCGQHGIFKWFVAPEYGGYGWSAVDIAEGYLSLSSACLTTTFVITQRTGACKRIMTGENQRLKERLLPQLATGEIFATVGISHLTTSHRHLATPVLQWEPNEEGFLLNGFAPWVTGGAQADYLIVGAQSQEEGQTLFCLPTALPGISFPAPFDLIALNGSCTGQVQFRNVQVAPEWLVAGPAENVLSNSNLTPSAGSGAGGLQTSVLALGLTRKVLDYLNQQGENRPELQDSVLSLNQAYDEQKKRLFQTIDGTSTCSKDELRSDANSLVTRSTQAAMIAAKGAGFVKGHPVGRWCTEALFFLVWSCPQAVSQKNLCEFAGIVD